MSEPGLVVVVDGPTLVGRSTTVAGLQAAWPDVRSGPLLEVGLDMMLRSFGPGTRRWQRLVLPADARRRPSRPGRSDRAAQGRGQASVHGMPPAASVHGMPPSDRGAIWADEHDDQQVGVPLEIDVVDIDLGPDPADEQPWSPQAGRSARSAGAAPGVWWGPLGREVVRGMHRAAAAWAHAGVDVAMDHLLVDRATVQDLHATMQGLRVVHVGLVCDPDVLGAREAEAGAPSGVAAAQQEASLEVAERDVTLDTSQRSTSELVEAILVEVRRRLRAAD